MLWELFLFYDINVWSNLNIIICLWDGFYYYVWGNGGKVNKKVFFVYGMIELLWEES